MLKLYNTRTRKKQAFKPLNPPKVGLYTCGPTVYNYAHLGNLRSYLFEDILKRTLLLNNFKVDHIMNITDVGHLTGDNDEGEDKMLKGAQREKKSVYEIAEFYTKAFKDDIKQLNILSPSKYTKATDHIKEQLALIQTLEEKGFTYEAGGNVYFDTAKFPTYKDFAQLKSTTKARVEKDKNKKNPTDFVLWFTKSKFQDQEMKWKSPYGVGYPGWHLECSAMAQKYLGDQFDIHCGGIDHIPVHHTNEIAQTQAATGKAPSVNFWLHNEFLVLEKQEKMSKSQENFLTLKSLEEQGFHPLDYRYFTLTAHYRKPLTFSHQAMQAAKTAREKLLTFMQTLLKEKKARANSTYLKAFKAALNDDLSTPEALALLWQLVKDAKITPSEKKATLLEIDNILAIGLSEVKLVKIPKEVEQLAKQREQARKNKNWQTSDELRDQINTLGYNIADTKDGYELSKR